MLSTSLLEKIKWYKPYFVRPMHAKQWLALDNAAFSIDASKYASSSYLLASTDYAAEKSNSASKSSNTSSVVKGEVSAYDVNSTTQEKSTKVNRRPSNSSKIKYIEWML